MNGKEERGLAGQAGAARAGQPTATAVRAHVHVRVDPWIHGRGRLSRQGGRAGAEKRTLLRTCKYLESLGNRQDDVPGLVRLREHRLDHAASVQGVHGQPLQPGGLLDPDWVAWRAEPGTSPPRSNQRALI